MVSKTVELVASGQVFTAQHQDETLLSVLMRNNVPIHSSCGGMGTCTTCRVVIIEDRGLESRNELEQEAASERGFDTNERLSCQIENWEYIKVQTEF